MRLKSFLLIGLLIALIVLGNQFILTGHAVRVGDLVSVQYEGRFVDGSVFDRSVEPLIFTVGSGQLISGFEQAVIGLEKDDEVTVTLSRDEGYGQSIPELITTVNKSLIAESIGQEPVIGLELTTSSGSKVKVVNVTDELVTIDMNHPFAGLNLTFWIKIVDIT